MRKTEAGTGCDHTELNFERQNGSSLQIVVQKGILDCISLYRLNFKSQEEVLFKLFCMKERLGPQVKRSIMDSFKVGVDTISTAHEEKFWPQQGKTWYMVASFGPADIGTGSNLDQSSELVRKISNTDEDVKHMINTRGSAVQTMDVISTGEDLQCWQGRSSLVQEPNSKDCLHLIFVASPCEKVISVSDENYITYAIRKFILDMPSPGSVQNIGL